MQTMVRNSDKKNKVITIEIGLTCGKPDVIKVLLGELVLIWPWPGSAATVPLAPGPTTFTYRGNNNQHNYCLIR